MVDEFFLDLDAHEQFRLASVLAASEGTYDPAVVHEGERKARELLYSGLDCDQQRIYDELKAAGVL
jgi:hypothetical protein